MNLWSSLHMEEAVNQDHLKAFLLFFYGQRRGGLAIEAESVMLEGFVILGLE